MISFSKVLCHSFNLIIHMMYLFLLLYFVIMLFDIPRVEQFGNGAQVVAGTLGHTLRRWPLSLAASGWKS